MIITSNADGSMTIITESQRDVDMLRIAMQAASIIYINDKREKLAQLPENDTENREWTKWYHDKMSAEYWDLANQFPRGRG